MADDPVRLFGATSATNPRQARKRFVPKLRLARLLAMCLCAGVAVMDGEPAPAQRPVMRTSQSGGPHWYGASPHHGHSRQTPCPTCPPAPYYAPPRSHEQLPSEQRPERREDGETPPSDDRAETAPDDQREGAPDTPSATPDAADFAAPPPAATAASLSGATGTPAAPASATPNMVGDFFATGSAASLRVPSSSGVFGTSPDGVLAPDPTESVVGRIKQAENYNPLPADRIFLDLTAYHNVPIGPAIDGPAQDIDVTRVTPGFETTYLDGMMSLEVRMPMAETLNSTVNYLTTPDTANWEPGDLNVMVKTLLVETHRMALAAGLGIRTPTANDLVFTDGFSTVEVENDALHLLPYLGLVLTPSRTFFAQTMLQVDVDANGNDVFLTQNAGRSFQGTIQDQTLLYNSYALGAWLYGDRCSRGLRIAATTEFHYSRALDDPDVVNTQSMTLTEGTVGGERFDTLTGVAGLHVLYADGAQLTFAYGAPLTEQRFADGEFRLMVNLGQPLGMLGRPTAGTYMR